MGTVYEASHLRLNNQVALKEMLSNGSPKALGAFEREAQLLAHLDHPNLPKVTDHFSENNGNFLVMQFINGLDLQEWLDLRSSPFQQELVLDWAKVLLEVLAYLHNHNSPVLHLDIKPANIKRTDDGRIFLLDFGLAKGSAGQMSTHTSSHGLVGGTVPYESFEQLCNGRIDARSDLYSLGATLYHLISGSRPANAAVRYHAIKDGEADPVQFGKEFSPSVADVIRQAMVIERTQRLSSAGEMHRLLVHAAEQDRLAGIKADYQLARERKREAERVREQGFWNANSFQFPPEVIRSEESLQSTLIVDEELTPKESLPQTNLDSAPEAEAVMEEENGASLSDDVGPIEPAVPDELPAVAIPSSVEQSPSATPTLSAPPAAKDSLPKNIIVGVPKASDVPLLQHQTWSPDLAPAPLILITLALLAIPVAFLFFLPTFLSGSKQVNSESARAAAIPAATPAATPTATPTPIPTSTPTSTPQSKESVPAPSDELFERSSFELGTEFGEVVTINKMVYADHRDGVWTNSGLFVWKGRHLLITASGEVSLGLISLSPRLKSETVRTGPRGAIRLGDTDSGKRMPDEWLGGLVAKIGKNSTDFIFIGAAKHVIADRTGVLYLGINEKGSSLNSGAFDVVIEAQTSR